MIEVLIVDDQKTVQEILRGYIEDDPHLKLAGCANNGREALDMIKTNRPHIVLMDIEMPILDGITATKIISEQFIDTKVLIISVHNEDSYLNTALQVGAKGYLLKNTPAKELVNAIYSAYKGYFQLGPGLLEKYLHQASDSQVNTEELKQLKTIVMQQSEYLKNIGGGKHSRGKNSSKNSRSRPNANNVDYLEDRYISLEKKVYILSNRVDKQSKKIAFLEQFSILVILTCGVMGVLFLVFVLR